MVSLKQKNQKGFTIVELLIVIVIIGILAGLVVTQFIGANQSARDSERKTDINSVASQLEVYFAKSGGYPTLANLTDDTWRSGNQFNAGDQGKALIAPNGTEAPDDSATPVANRYAYIPTPGGCEASTDNTGEKTGTTNPCTGFSLSVKFENAKDGSADASGNYVKKNAE